MEFVNPLSIMPRDIEDEIRKDAVARYPEESVGVISNGRYLPLRNISDDPEKNAIPERETFMNLLMDRAVDALVHSHPDAPFAPSSADMMTQIDLDVPCGVVGVYRGAASRVALWGDSLERRDLIKRPFQHAITDCYEGIRDHYLLKCGFLIKQFPRDWDWWTPRYDQKLYIDGFSDAGFYRVPHEEARANDGVLFRIRSQTHNHAGVYLGDGTMYHHATAREPFSPKHEARIEPIHRWLEYDPIFVRPDPNHPSVIHV